MFLFLLYLQGFMNVTTFFFYRTAAILLFFQKPFSSGKVISKRQVCWNFSTVQLLWWTHFCINIIMNEMPLKLDWATHSLTCFLWSVPHFMCVTFPLGIITSAAFLSSFWNNRGDVYLAEDFVLFPVVFFLSNLSLNKYLVHKLHYYLWLCKAMPSTCHDLFSLQNFSLCSG